MQTAGRKKRNETAPKAVNEEPKVIISIKVTRAFRRTLRVKAAMEGATLGDTVIGLLQAALK